MHSRNLQYLSTCTEWQWQVCFLLLWSTGKMSGELLLHCIQNSFLVVDNAPASFYICCDWWLSPGSHHSGSIAAEATLSLYSQTIVREREGDTLLSCYPRLLETGYRILMDETHFYQSTVKHILSARKDFKNWKFAL